MARTGELKGKWMPLRLRCELNSSQLDGSTIKHLYVSIQVEAKKGNW